MERKFELVKENNETFAIVTGRGTHKFKVVETVPSEYEVWNIGDNMCSPDYIPFCVAEGNRIKAESLITVKLPVEDVKILRKVASYGTTNVQGIKARLRRMAKLEVSRELLEKALIILGRITSPTEILRFKTQETVSTN